MAEQFQNFFVTKLREACDATATTIYVDTIPAITEGTLVLEYANSTKHEIIHFTGVSGYGLTGCTRGLEGTTAQSHSAGTDVRQNLTAGIIDKIINGVITTENIADSAVTTAKINNGAVTSDKIDFTTLPVLYSTTTSEKSGTITSVTVTEAGKYLVICSGSGYNVGGTGSLYLAIQVNGTNTDYSQRYGGSTSNRYGMTISGIVDASVNDVISAYSANIDGGSAQIRSGFFLGIIRVG